MIRGFACGVFDIYHPGHVLMLRECAAHCDHLTVAINTAENFDDRIYTGKRIPIFTAEERILLISSVSYVDEVKSYSDEDELTDIMTKGNFDIRFLGDDYQGRLFTAPNAIANIRYIDRSHGYSTTAILERIKKRLTDI